MAEKEIHEAAKAVVESFEYHMQDILDANRRIIPWKNAKALYALELALREPEDGG